RPAVLDTTGRRLSYGKTLVSAIALADEIDRTGDTNEKIGVLMPSSVAGLLVNVALTIAGRVPVNLNFTASAEAMASAIRQCNMKTVVTSRAFVEKLEGIVLPEGAVYLEDIVPRISGGAKIAALLKALFAPMSALCKYRVPGADDVATIIFSSGSTGEPKGVMLSHHNIISNIEAFRMLLHLEPQDRMCGILPFFHSFGYTCSMWCPLLSGFFAAFHPNPLDAGKVADLVRDEKLTVFLATPTFLLGYIRKAKKDDFASLRILVVGAEKLKKKVADAFEERFALRPREGYGATELSPVVSLNVPDVDIAGVKQPGTREGSIGHPVPGVHVKVVDPDTMQPVPEGQQGLLLVKGPNVMLGYLGNPAKTAEVLKDGWYNTGDIARVDEDGFVFLLDRLSRYSKIGGEMIPHIAVEDHYMQALGAVTPVIYVTSAPDEKKGEQLIVFYTQEAGEVEKLQGIIADADIPNLWKPRKENYFKIEALPTLGSGKIDQKRLKDLAVKSVEQRAAGVPASLDRKVAG
ncbi:MAG: acyl-[ACP]--phospholipid O-acyltransferase, partial [Verrucomicrobia bacterium]|nr:acyl-[ACP]--phospholipid O-acyltransferase [Verrucomicrobiota bacterium]